ncbi:4-hydroxy-tetrahydrodipicolinate reductase [Lacinutrix neustonica]|uniref:4-hydroxy-tetrahydrodipicolinate reductase n=1 Tax=Lacinutrix neustonica TaxID=2980107 RepID=A0A9E8SE88_9FLAO|nr:4-hydroxy-tetrahydrodipicolinate reductase [Lacinutrix neustonica]WAC03288.1 4-hydroxy-tetrahydrodipicolinate reductase [Lacinutrix neustonica]
MKIALLGYGKMGKTIEAIALERGHTIVLKTSKTVNQAIKNADVAIDFSIPGAAVNNITHCINHNIPVIYGTTGWLDQYDRMVQLCHEKQGAFIYASNFSLGVNIFFQLNKSLAKMMATLKDYAVSLEEIHHTQKLDAPSGTAISLANDIIKNHDSYNHWALDQNQEKTIPITAKRIENVAGTHTVTYTSEVDTLEIKHTAHSRQGFALGAVVAAEWLHGKVGVFTMKDVLNIG